MTSTLSATGGDLGIEREADYADVRCACAGLGTSGVGGQARARRATPHPGDYHGSDSGEVRTPLGLVEEADGTFTVFYTGFEQPADWTRLLESKPVNTFAIGFARVRLNR